MTENQQDLLAPKLRGRQTALSVPALFNHRCDAALVPSGAGMGLHCAQEEDGQNELQGSSAVSPFPLLSPCPKAKAARKPQFATARWNLPIAV